MHLFKPIKNLNTKSIATLLDIFVEKNFVYISDVSSVKSQSILISEYKEFALENGVQSVLFFPFFDGNGKLKGIISFSKKSKCDLDKVDLVYINYFLSIIKNFIQKDLIGKKYKAIFNNKEIGFLLLDIKGRIIGINKRAARYFGYSEKELLNEHYEKYIHKDFLEKMRYYFKNRTLVNDLPKEYLTTIICKDGSTKILKVSVALLENNQRIMALADQTKQIKEKNN